MEETQILSLSLTDIIHMREVMEEPEDDPLDFTEPLEKVSPSKSRGYVPGMLVDNRNLSKKELLYINILLDTREGHEIKAAVLESETGVPRGTFSGWKTGGQVIGPIGGGITIDEKFRKALQEWYENKRPMGLTRINKTIEIEEIEKIESEEEETVVSIPLSPVTILLNISSRLIDIINELSKVREQIEGFDKLIKVIKEIQYKEE